MNNDIRETFKRFRKALNEAEEKTGNWYNPKQNGVPYSQQDELLQSSINSTREQFGADFSNIKTPMFYYKDDGDITLSGEIPTMNNARFQFSYRAYPNGCFFWGGDGEMIITDDIAMNFKKIIGVYKNWKQEIDRMPDKKPMGMSNNEN